LVEAARYGQDAVCEYFMSIGADVNLAEAYVCHPLHVCSSVISCVSLFRTIGHDSAPFDKQRGSRNNYPQVNSKQS
jgi:hypothetical protein